MTKLSSMKLILEDIRVIVENPEIDIKSKCKDRLLALCYWAISQFKKNRIDSHKLVNLIQLNNGFDDLNHRERIFNDWAKRLRMPSDLMKSFGMQNKITMK